MRRGALPILCFYWVFSNRGRHKVSQEAPEKSFADNGLSGQGRQPFNLALQVRFLNPCRSLRALASSRFSSRSARLRICHPIDRGDVLKNCIELGGLVLDFRSQTVISTTIENVASVIAISDQTALDSELDGRAALL